jgi:raffinose/stachyose/melibiose transport system substrate-binding protein
MFTMNKVAKIAAVAMASMMAIASITPAATAAGTACAKRTTVTMLGTIKIEIQDQFLAAVKDYNKSQKCYTLKSIPGDRKLTFLQNVTPMYAAHHAPTIMYTLQEIPNMASKVMNWKGTPLAKLVPSGLLAGATVGKKLAGIPSTAEAFGLVYNKKVLDAAGIDPAKITTRDALEAALKKVKIHFSGLWWSLGAHVSNIYFTNAAATHEGRLKVLDAMANGTKDLASDPVWKNYVATFDLMKKYADAAPNLTDTEYDTAVADLAAGKAGFWFMGNWAEPSLMTAAAGTNFGLMPLPISNNAKDAGNTSISVGVPGYFMVDTKQNSKAQQKGAIDFLTWLYTSKKGQHHVADPVTKGGMSFIPVYKGFKVQPGTFMSKQIAGFIAKNKVLDWMNTYYPAGGQDKYGASGQKYMTDTITAAQYAQELQDAWKGVVKTWRGQTVN